MASLASRFMEPEVALIAPTMVRSRVDLPEPLGPTMVTNGVAGQFD